MTTVQKSVCKDVLNHDADFSMESEVRAGSVTLGSIKKIIKKGLWKLSCHTESVMTVLHSITLWEDLKNR